MFKLFFLSLFLLHGFLALAGNSPAKYLVFTTDGRQIDADPDFGSVNVGSTKVAGPEIGLGIGVVDCPDCSFAADIFSVHLDGSPDFTIDQDGCSGHHISIGANPVCYMWVSFTPTSVGTKSANLVFSVRNYFHGPDGVDGSFDSILTSLITGTGVSNSVTIPYTDSQVSCQIPFHSQITVDNLSLQETIPVVGAPFDLHYSSDRLKSGFPYSYRKLGLGSWSPSIVHHYDFGSKTLYLGDGSWIKSEALKYGDNYFVSSRDAQEIYIINSNGQHISTRNALTNILKYSIQYDEYGRLVRIVDTFGNQTEFLSSLGIVQVSSPFGKLTLLNIDQDALLRSVTNPNGEVYQMTYQKDLLASFTKPNGGTSYFTYDENGFLLKDQGPAGDVFSFLKTFDPTLNSQTVSMRSSLGRVSTFRTDFVDENKSSHSTKTPDGMTVNSQYDLQGLSSTTDSLGQKNTSSSNPDPRFGWMSPYQKNSRYTVPEAGIDLNTSIFKSASLLDPNDPFSLSTLTTEFTLQNDPSRKFTSIYSAADRLFTSKSPLDRVTYQKLNAQGLTASIQIGSTVPINLSYDSKGRLIQSQQGDRRASTSYDIQGNIASQTDSLGRTTSFLYDNAGRMIQEKLPDGNIIKASYDSNGNLTSLTPSGRPKHEFIYNLMDFVSAYLPPSINSQVKGVTSYSYNLDKQLTQISRPDGSQVELSYDPTSSLMTQIKTPSGIYSYNYKQNSNLIASVKSPDQITNYYTYAGTLLKSVQSAGLVPSTIIYNHAADASLVSISIGSSNIAFYYDRDGLLIQSGDLKLQRNDFGAVQNTALGKIESVKAFDSYGQVSSDKFTAGKKSLYSLELKRDKLGHITQSQESIHNKITLSGFGYDEQGRLTKASDGLKVRVYQYDSNGNRISKIEDVRATQSKYDAQDRLMSSGNFEYIYNINGELEQKIEHRFENSDGRWNTKNDVKKITNYQFDSFGNLKKVSLPTGVVIEYLIDGQNRRVGKKLNGVLVEGYIYQSQTQIAGVTGGNGNLIRRFVYGEKCNIPDYFIESNGTFRIISDHLGTPRLVVNATSGDIDKKLEFDEFGIQAKSNGDYSRIPFGFAGGLYDRDTRLVHFGARDYDPETGRFISKDPIGFGGGDTNLYGYVANDPINYFDPSGLDSQLLVDNHGHFSLEVITGGKVTTISLGPADPSLRIGNVMGTVAITDGRDVDNHAVPFSLKRQSAAADMELIRISQALQKAYDNGDLGYNFLGGSINGWGTNCLVFSKTLQNSVGN